MYNKTRHKNFNRHKRDIVREINTKRKLWHIYVNTDGRLKIYNELFARYLLVFLIDDKNEMMIVFYDYKIECNEPCRIDDIKTALELKRYAYELMNANSVEEIKIIINNINVDRVLKRI